MFANETIDEQNLLLAKPIMKVIVKVIECYGRLHNCGQLSSPSIALAVRLRTAAGLSSDEYDTAKLTLTGDDEKEVHDFHVGNDDDEEVEEEVQRNLSLQFEQHISSTNMIFTTNQVGVAEQPQKRLQIHADTSSTAAGDEEKSLPIVNETVLLAQAILPYSYCGEASDKTAALRLS